MRQLIRPGAILLFLGVAACGDSSKPAPPPSAPIRMACTTPQEAGMKALDVTRKLTEALDAKRITADEFRAFDATLGVGRRAWSERQDLKAYCGSLEKVVQDAKLQ
jgi:hypothetical protein